MNDTKRTILAFVISFAILMGWYVFFTPNKGGGSPQAPAASSSEPLKVAATQAAKVEKEATVSGAPLAVANAVSEEKAYLKNPLVEIQLTNRGAKVEQVKLLKYNDKSGAEGKPLVLMNGGNEGAGLTRLADSAFKSGAIFAVGQKTENKVTYLYRTSDGLLIEKTYELNPTRYDVNLTVRVVNEGKSSFKDKLTVYMVGDFSAGHSRYIYRGPAYSQSGGFEEVDADDSAKGKFLTGQINWAGVIENYFLWAIVPKDVAGAELRLESDESGKTIIKVELGGPALEIAPGAAQSREYRLYVGPKNKDDLVAVGAGLESALYYGWFTIIAKPLLNLLNLLYGFVGNYGIAIIILTALVKLLFWPLSAKSYKSMARMKDLQPKIEKLKERYGEDREKLNSEMMQLWKTHKVNPFSGCLPILVQIPVFIALYRVLMSSIEIRHAPFLLWLHDLSAPDPYYITPLLMGGSMFLQQKMTPATGMGDGQMKFMLYGMPILFTYLFKDFASGLVVYWLMNNVFSIAQQWILMRNGKAKPKAA